MCLKITFFSWNLKQYYNHSPYFFMWTHNPGLKDSYINPKGKPWGYEVWSLSSVQSEDLFIGVTMFIWYLISSQTLKFDLLEQNRKGVAFEQYQLTIQSEKTPHRNHAWYYWIRSSRERFVIPSIFTCVLCWSVVLLSFLTVWRKDLYGSFTKHTQQEFVVLKVSVKTG